MRVDITGNEHIDIDWIRVRTKKRKLQDTGVINAYVVAAGLVRTLAEKQVAS